jgi:hypothetical protein
MKRIFILTGILTIFLVGCEIHPYADFLVDKKYAQPGDIIYFTNLSERGSTYHWDFGDGTVTNIVSPSHVYTYEGTFEVILTVTSRDGNRDVATFIVQVYYPDLEITVADIDFPEIKVPGASVRLYPTLRDWELETNMVVEGFTDSYGIITFYNLNSQHYYVDVWEANYDNWNLSNSYITTLLLEPALLNTYIAWVEYYPPAVKRTRSDKKSVIKSRSKSQNIKVTDQSK